MSLTIPLFENEEQEAQWWYDHRDEVEEDFVQGLKDGRVKRASDTERGRRVIRAAKRALAAREAAKALIASVSDEDRNRFHQLAVQAGLDDETYIQQVLLNALASAEVLAA
jgi:DNA-binding MarR family transcriptional regulator